MKLALAKSKIPVSTARSAPRTIPWRSEKQLAAKEELNIEHVALAHAQHDGMTGSIVSI